MIDYCVICGKPYEKYDSSKKTRRHTLRSRTNRSSGGRYKRPCTSKTCSKVCARIYYHSRKRPGFIPHPPNIVNKEKAKE